MLRRRTELFAEAAHVRVHRARVNQAVVFPHIPKQGVPGLHAPGALREGGEQLEFGRGQFKRPALPVGQMPRHVNQQVAEPHLVARFLPGFAPRKDFFDAEQEFARAERLGQVIIRAQLQAEHPVNLGGLGREHDDGNPGGGRVEPQGLANFNRASGGSGSITASPAVGSARPSARRSARRASPTSGSRTAKEPPVDRKGPRVRLAESLDAVFAEPIDPKFNRDAVEGKLFGIGSESYVVGSHEFYYGYAVTRKKLLCLDAGHYHPTEVVSDKISAVLQHLDEILLHVSRGVRWDSDHVVILSDGWRRSRRAVRGDYLGRVHVGLDFFDASINRVAAWVIGTRAMLKALLLALLEPTESLRRLEAEGDNTARLALLEELKAMPFGAVWDHHCRTHDVPPGRDWLAEVKTYERDVLRVADLYDGHCPKCRRAHAHRREPLAGGRQDQEPGPHTEADGHQQVVRRRAGLRGCRSTCAPARCTRGRRERRGKSTLIKVITGAHRPDEGTIEVNGQAVEDLDPVTARGRGSRRSTSSRRSSPT